MTEVTHSVTDESIGTIKIGIDFIKNICSITYITSQGVAKSKELFVKKYDNYHYLVNKPDWILF